MGGSRSTSAIPVADLDDPRLALYRGVQDPDLLRAHGVFIAEGRLVVERLLAQSHFRARSVLVTPAAHAGLRISLDRATCPVYLIDAPLMQRLTGFHIHRGCLAIAERGQPREVADLAASVRRPVSLQPGPLVCLEAVGNPDNVGGVFRNAAAFGASGVILSPGCSDPLYRKSIRTSMGASLSVPFAVATDWPRTVAELRKEGWSVVALTPAEDASEIQTAAPTLLAERVALVLGHEGGGLSPEVRALASRLVRIPVTTNVDSLNVATAAAIALYVVTSGKSGQCR